MSGQQVQGAPRIETSCCFRGSGRYQESSKPGRGCTEHPVRKPCNAANASERPREDKESAA
eukprot:3425348-Amphidinium_carterae.6